MLFPECILLAAEAPPQPAQGLGGSGALMIALLVAMVVMTVVSSRNQKKDRQKLQEWVDSLQKNTSVITRGGIHGTVVSVREDSVVLKIDEDKGVRMTVAKDAIVGIPSSAKKDT